MGAFKKGHAKVGGRKKGSVNKKTFRELLEKEGFFFEQELVKTLRAIRDQVEKVKALKGLMPYLQPEVMAAEPGETPKPAEPDASGLSDENLLKLIGTG